MKRVLCLAVLLAGCQFRLQTLPEPGGPRGPTYHLTAIFDDALNLTRGAQVKLNGIVVGQVTSITAQNFTARVGMVVKRSAQLPDGTTAEVRFDTPLGNEFVALQPSTAGGAPLGNGAVLPDTRTSAAPNVEDVFAALSTLLNGGGLNQLHTIVAELNAAFAGNETPTRAVLAELDHLGTALNGSLPQIDHALTAFHQLSGALAAGDPVIARGLTALAPAMRVLDGETSDLGQLLTSVTNLGQVTAAALNADHDAVVSDIHELVPVVDQLVGLQGEIGPALADIATFEAKVPQAIPGAYLNLNVSIVGMLGVATRTAGPALPALPPGGIDAATGLLAAGVAG